MLLIACLLMYGCGEDHADTQARSNWFRHDRSENRLAYHYGRNLLASCDPGAILFTQGDNDTYPLWYLQEVEGFRRDICVVNLSLLNAPWYIRQLRDRFMGVPLDMSDEFIDRRLSGGPGALGVLKWLPESAPETAAGITWDLPPDTILTDDIGLLSVAHYVLVRIIDTVSWSRPLYFSSAVAPAHFIGLDRYLSYEGLVYRLTPDRSPGDGIRTDRSRLMSNLTETYVLDGIAGDSVYRSPDTERILDDYFDAYLALTSAQALQGDTAGAEEAMQTVRTLARGNPGREQKLGEISDQSGREHFD